ncbi:MAG: hypothetical protein KJZ65_10155 [Phycisphaerales bacterium]|nr:hypothetical protein [Phycisphaerales bacterium]
MIEAMLVIAMLAQTENAEQAARRLYGEGRYPEAAAVYAELPASPEHSYNRGCALLAAGDFEQAAAAFRQAADAPGALAARARFNLGHALLKQAQSPAAAPQANPMAGNAAPAAAAPDSRKTLEQLRRSAAAFRSVLEVDPTDAEAARNTELVRRMIRDLEEQMKQAQQQQQQAGEQARKMQEQAEKIEQLANQQQAQADQSRNSPPSQAEERVQEQQAINDQTREQMQQLAEELGPDPAAGQAARQMQEAMQEQREAMQDLADRRPDRASEDMQEAADKLREAAQQLREAARQQQQGQKSDDQQAGQKGEQPQEATPQDQDDRKSPEEQLAERILQVEKAQREQRAANRRLYSVPVPVKKDW